MISKLRSTFAQTRLTPAPLRPLGPPAVCRANSCRFYAYSRFQDRGPGSHRTRERLERLNPRKRAQDNPDVQADGVWRDVRVGPFTFRVWENSRTRTWTSNDQLSDQQHYNNASSEPQTSRPEQDESPLWEAASQRAPASDPREGLERLLMGNGLLVVTRQIEMLNIFVGFEQSNKYVITNENEEVLGYIAEEPRGLFSMFSRQLFRTHRPFRALVMDSAGTPILWLRRPFAWINSRMFVQRLKNYDEYDRQGEPVLDTFGEVQQRWHPWRRRYDLFLREQQHRILTAASEPQPEPLLEPESFRQMARIDDGFLAWHFTLRGGRGEEIGSVDRAFRGLGRELFTDTGRYYVRFGPRPESPPDEYSSKPSIIRDLTLDERALILATAVDIDFDYFSHHSGGGGWGPLLLFTAWE